jgi:hypothetical protein
MFRHFSTQRSLIPTAFTFGVCSLVSCLLLMYGIHKQEAKLGAAATPLTMGGPRFTHAVPALAFSPSVGERPARPARCRIHGAEMKSVLVPVRYGLPVYDDHLMEYGRVHNASFPHCDDALYGGCFPANEEDFTDVCQECNAARDKWLHEHPRKAPLR